MAQNNFRNFWCTISPYISPTVAVIFLSAGKIIIQRVVFELQSTDTWMQFPLYNQHPDANIQAALVGNFSDILRFVKYDYHFI